MTASQTLELVSHEDGLPDGVYLGGSLPASGDLEALADERRTTPGQPGIVVAAADGMPLPPLFKLLRRASSTGG